jgi:ornithine--oxo-acid transaminase
MTETMTSRMSDLIELSSAHSAHNYSPLPVVIDEAEGAWVTDVEGDATWTCSPRIRR